MTIIPRVVWDLGALLGEGPAWFGDEGVLRFVDIKAGRLHRYDPGNGEQTSLYVGGMPSFIVPEAGGGALVGSGDRVFLLEADRLGRAVATIDMPGHNRTNDATVDVGGRVWLGTMDDDERRPTGALYRLDAGGLHHLGCEAVVTNGPAVTGDGRWLYYVDSGNRRIWRRPVEEGAALGEARCFLQFDEGVGFPDGLVLDSEDCLWVAFWDGWSIRRFAPDGTLLLAIEFPCARVTKLAFGGPDLRTAFVTTARVGLNSSTLDAQPLAGALFAFDSPVAGNRLPAAILS